MLNTDFGLLYDLKLDAEFRSTCPVSAGAEETCPHMSTYEKAQEYSEVSKQPSPRRNEAIHLHIRKVFQMNSIPIWTSSGSIYPT